MLEYDSFFFTIDRGPRHLEVSQLPTERCKIVFYCPFLISENQYYHDIVSSFLSLPSLESSWIAVRGVDCPIEVRAFRYTVTEVMALAGA